MAQVVIIKLVSRYRPWSFRKLFKFEDRCGVSGDVSTQVMVGWGLSAELCGGDNRCLAAEKAKGL